MHYLCWCTVLVHTDKFEYRAYTVPDLSFASGQSYPPFLLVVLRTNVQ